MKKTKSFTLSEVLITLAIIGIVAALTIPVFIDITNGIGYKTSYKKMISTLTRAVAANSGQAMYDFRDVSGYYGNAVGPIECYDLPGGAPDGPFIGSDTVEVSTGGDWQDMRSDSISLFHIFHSYLNMMNSHMLQNYDVAASFPELKCADNEPAGAKIVVKDAGMQKTANIVNKIPNRMSPTLGKIAQLCNGRSLANGGFNQGRMFMLEDGSVFTYDPAQTYCTESNPCYGYIDVNGPKPPNRVIACSVGEDSYIPSYGRNGDEALMLGTCEVKAQNITDIFPVLFYNQVVKPATWAAKAAYFDRVKSNQVGELILPDDGD